MVSLWSQGLMVSQGLMMWWCGLRVLCCGGVVSGSCGLSVLFSGFSLISVVSVILSVIQSNNNNFYFYLLFSGSSVLSLLFSVFSGSYVVVVSGSYVVVVWWSRGLMVWWWVLLITGLSNSRGVLWGQGFWVLCGRGGNGVTGIRK